MIPPEPPEGPRRGTRKRVEPEDAALHRQSEAAKREAKRVAKETLQVLRFSSLVAQLDELQQEVRRILAQLPPAHETAHHVTPPPPLPLTMTRPLRARRWTPLM